MTSIIVYLMAIGGLAAVAGTKPFDLAIGDLRLLATASGRMEFIRENHHKHFILTILVAIALFYLAALIPSLQIAHWPLWIAPLMGYMLGFGVNGYVEARRQMKGGKDKAGNWNVPFCYRDVRFGALGGAIGTTLIIYAL